MITYAYSQRNQYNSTPIRTFLCGVVFLDITAFFFLSFMNICFDQIVRHPPLWLMIVLFLIMALDLVAQLYFNKCITVRFVVNLIIMIFLILSWTIKNNYILFLSAMIFIRFPQILKYNQIMKDLIRGNHKSIIVYTLCKIIYLFVIVGHVFGCIFYAIDNTLIKQEYYGSIQQNPNLYYQGNLLCYTPIYSLSEQNRYLYCMYYIVSLLSTIAYGDIIPKNPFQNAYVCFLLVFSTVSISFIIEQLLIVLGDEWETVYNTIKKVKYLDSMLQKSTKIGTQNRLKLINFLFHTMIHESNHNPNIDRLTSSLQVKLMGESIGLKKKVHKSVISEEMNKISNFRIYQEYSLPAFLAQYFLLKLQLKYYPGNYLILDNRNMQQLPQFYITFRGEFKLGYGPYFLMRKIVKEKNKLIGWRQFIWNNKLLHKEFRVQTRGLCQMYSVSVQFLKQMIKTQRIKSLSDDNFKKMLEKYHYSKQQELTKIYYEKQQVQLIYEANLDSSLKNQEQQYLQQISHHIIRCWGCGKKNHYPLNCPNLHYKINSDEIFTKNTQNIQRINSFNRKNRKNKKVIQIYIKDQDQIQHREYIKNYLTRKTEQINILKSLFYGTKKPIFEQYQSYENFYHQFCLQNISDNQQ